MSCHFCIHWKEPADVYGPRYPKERSEQSDYWDKLVGQCCRYPEWTGRTGGHYCGEFTAGSFNKLGAYWNFAQRSVEGQKDERRRAVSAEKKLKQVKKEMRELKRGPKP